MEWTEISKYTFRQFLDAFFNFYEQRYHRTVVTREEFVEECLLEQVTLPPALLEWVKEWQKEQ